jgi:hypothetical protein
LVLEYPEDPAIELHFGDKQGIWSSVSPVENWGSTCVPVACARAHQGFDIADE